jgi:hypothetical protein
MTRKRAGSTGDSVGTRKQRISDANLNMFLEFSRAATSLTRSLSSRFA